MTDESTSGVQDLIDRLSLEGVAEGQRQADAIVRDAERKADQILDTAQQQARELLDQARQDAKNFQQAGEEALRLAARDAVRDFGAKIHDGMRHRLQELVTHQMKEPKLIRRMILEITRQATRGIDESAEVLLPPEIISEEQARQRIEAGESDHLIQFVESLIGESLREGFELDLGTQNQTGMKVRVVNQQVEIDLTDGSIAELLERHLLPRFRAIMRKT